MSIKRNLGDSIECANVFLVSINHRKNGDCENFASTSRLYVNTHFAWNCQDSCKSLHASRHILHEVFSYSLLAVFWFSTSSSIASLRFSGGGTFAFVILNSPLSTIFHCRCFKSSIVIASSRSLDNVNESGTIVVRLLTVSDQKIMRRVARLRKLSSKLEISKRLTLLKQLETDYKQWKELNDYIHIMRIWNKYIKIV